MSAPIETRDVQAGGVTFHVSETGPRDGEVIVFLHGSGPGATALSNWERIIADLGDTYRCVAPDIVGFGESTHPDPPPQGLAAFTKLRVDTLLALFDELGVRQATLVGNSMGGIISLKLTLQAPERVRALVLMGTGGAPVGGLTAGLLKLITFYDDATADNMAQLMTYFVHDQAFFGDDLQSIAAARMPMASRPEVERSHRATFAPGDPLGIDETVVATITQPTLVVHGDDDQVMPVVSGQWFADHLPNARLEVFADTGHWLQIEQAPRFLASIRSFLADLR